jgi:hypothetical protein
MKDGATEGAATTEIRRCPAEEARLKGGSISSFADRGSLSASPKVVVFFQAVRGEGADYAARSHWGRTAQSKKSILKARALNLVPRSSGMLD